jgi:RNA-directed DNA polymerase
MKPIFSLRRLAWTLGVPIERLRELAADVRPHYREWPRRDPRNPDKIRVIRSPSDELKGIQRRINRQILSAAEIGSEVHGGVRGKSSRSNAENHLGQRMVVTVDVRQFFPSVRHYIVYRLFRRELGFGRDVARVLTQLTTLRGALPQGAPTSVPIANILLAKAVDAPVSSKASSSGHGYTRFVDDAAFSGNDPRSLINIIARLLSTRRLSIHREKPKWHKKQKLKIMPRSQPQEVTGLLVNGLRPTISRQRRDRVRAAIHQLRQVADDQKRRKAVTSIRSRIAYVAPFNPGPAKRLQRYLDLNEGNNRIP